MLLHQSDLGAWDRCPSQYRYSKEAVGQLQTSALAYGVVMHHALQVLETNRDLKQAVATFLHYWHPHNISELTPPVSPEGWMPQQSYGSLRSRGVTALHQYADLMSHDDSELLALEYEFTVEVPGTWDPLEGRPHRLGGTIDRLAARHYKRNLVLAVDDFKTGKRYARLRHNMQGTAYCFASTQRAFWDGFDDRAEAMYQRFHDKARRFTWIDMKQVKFNDGGFRDSVDYQRFAHSLQTVADSIQAGIYPLTINGEACTYCEFRKICVGLPVPDDTYGRPA